MLQGIFLVLFYIPQDIINWHSNSVYPLQKNAIILRFFGVSPFTKINISKFQFNIRTWMICLKATSGRTQKRLTRLTLLKKTSHWSATAGFKCGRFHKKNKDGEDGCCPIPLCEGRIWLIDWIFKWKRWLCRYKNVGGNKHCREFLQSGVFWI